MGQRTVKISRDSFMGLFKMDGSKRIEMIGMPKDAKLVSISETAFFLTNQIAFIVESQEFSESEEGQERPELEIWVNEVGVGSVEEAKMALKAAMERERQSEMFISRWRDEAPKLPIDMRESKAV